MVYINIWSHHTVWVTCYSINLIFAQLLQHQYNSHTLHSMLQNHYRSHLPVWMCLVGAAAGVGPVPATRITLGCAATGLGTRAVPYLAWKWNNMKCSQFKHSSRTWPVMWTDTIYSIPRWWTEYGGSRLLRNKRNRPQDLWCEWREDQNVNVYYCENLNKADLLLQSANRIHKFNTTNANVLQRTWKPKVLYKNVQNSEERKGYTYNL
jgi:hypothetical protein